MRSYSVSGSFGDRYPMLRLVYRPRKLNLRIHALYTIVLIVVTKYHIVYKLCTLIVRKLM